MSSPSSSSHSSSSSAFPLSQNALPPLDRWQNGSGQALGRQEGWLRRKFYHLNKLRKGELKKRKRATANIVTTVSASNNKKKKKSNTFSANNSSTLFTTLSSEPSGKITLFWLLKRLQIVDSDKIFARPVPKSVPFYHDVVAHPMDFFTIKTNIQKYNYIGPSGLQSFYADVQLIIDNCRTYNQEGCDAYEAANVLETEFHALKEETEKKWLLETVALENESTSSSSTTSSSTTSSTTSSSTTSSSSSSSSSPPPPPPPSSLSSLKTAAPTSGSPPTSSLSPHLLLLQERDPVGDIATFVAEHKYNLGDFDPYYYMDGFEKDRNVWDKEPYSVRPYEKLMKYVPVIDSKKTLKELNTTKLGCSAAPDCLPSGAAEKLDFQALREGRPLTHSNNSPWPQTTVSSSSSSLPGPDLIRTNTWGIDAKTRRRILWVLERFTALSESDRFHFVSSILLPTINRQKDHQAHDIRYSLLEIQKISLHHTGNAKNHAAATALLRYLARSDAATDTTTSTITRHGINVSHLFPGSNGSSNRFLPHLTTMNDFRIHPKGQGIVCARRDHIAPYTFVSEYIGELYPPWRWFEKQDAVKTIQKKLKKEEGALPDFYNITLERHADDKDGFGVQFVDPIARGNFASRLSHSCHPNCATVVIACDGRYTICVYTLRKIHYGEELTFDYNSVTEDKDEFRRAVCLCGSKSCRGSFLYYANSSTFQQVFSQKMTSLVRTANILRCSEEPLTNDDEIILKKHGFGTVLLPKGIAPNWLKKFIVLTLEFISLERKELPKEIRKFLVIDDEIYFSFYNLS
jgi:hypothetical protein